MLFPQTCEVNMPAQHFIQKRNVVSAIPDIEYMDIYEVSKHHLLLRVRFFEKVRFPNMLLNMLKNLEFRLKRGRKSVKCRQAKVRHNKLGHWEFHLKPKKGKFPFGKKSIFRRRDNFKDQTIEIQILFAENWQSFFPHLY